MQRDKEKKITGFHLLKSSTFWEESRWMQETDEQNQNTEFWEKSNGSSTAVVQVLNLCMALQ